MIALALSALFLFGYGRFVEHRTETMLIITAVSVAMLTPLIREWLPAYGLGMAVIVSAAVVVIVSLKGSAS